MTNKELTKKVEMLEREIESLKKHVDSLSKSLSYYPHPAVVNSFIQQQSYGSIFDRLF